MKKIVLTLGLFLAFVPAFSQGFNLVSTQFGMNFVNFGPDDGFGLSFFDYNQDGWDDLIYVLKDDSVKILNNNEGVLSLIPSPIYVEGDAKQPVWVDYDNDGDYDLFISVTLGPCLLFENQDGELVDVSVQAGIPQYTDAMSYSNSWGDYDRDGDLDCYISNYNFPEGHNNWLLRNNGDGTFDEIAEELGVNNGSKHTYQSVWLDYDHDMWPDLYVTNDKEPANALYHNNGDGTFTDVSEESGADLVFHAMCAAVADFDNDEDLDVYMTNEPYGNRLLRNEGDGTFNEYADFIDLELDKLTWGATWLDYDNNTLRDLIVCSTDFPSLQQNYLMINTGNTFVDGSWLGVDDEHHFSYGCAKGDYDNDGYYDFAISNSGGDPQDLYHNEGGNNNWVKFDLEGTVSNRDAIGTWTSWWIGADKYVDYSFCGEGYLSQDSQHEIIGLGSAMQIDSLLIEWPSGIEEMYYNIQAGSSVHFVEGFIPGITLEAESFSLCPGDSTDLSVVEQFSSYTWSNGDSGSETTIDEGGEFTVTVTYNGGLNYTSSPISIESLEPAELITEVNNVVCFGENSGSIAISSESELDSIFWDSGEESFELTELAADDYNFEILDGFGCTQFSSITISQPDSLASTPLTTDVTCPGGSNGVVTINIIGGTPPYSLDSQGLDLEALSAGNYALVANDSLGCAIDINFSIFEPYPFDLGLELTHASDNDGAATTNISGGTSPYAVQWSNNESGESVDNLSPGDYTVTVIDAEGCKFSEDFTIEQADNIPDWARSIIAYPNPAKSYIELSTPYVSASLLSLDGRIVESWTYNQSGSTLALNDIPSGTYVLRVDLTLDEQITLKVSVAQ